MGLDVFSNGTKVGTWSAVFPNFNQTADFHHWKAYPNFAMVTLAAGPQVIKLRSKTKHLQLDYVQFDRVGADGASRPPTRAPPLTAAPPARAARRAPPGTSGAGATGVRRGRHRRERRRHASGATGAAGVGSGARRRPGRVRHGGLGQWHADGRGGKGSTSSAKSGGCSLGRPGASGSAGPAGSFLAVAAMALGLIGRSPAAASADADERARGDVLASRG